MGMDYRYAGSASYPRFETELRQVAKALGCLETAHLDGLQAQSKQQPFGYWFGCMSGDNTGKAKFSVPAMLPEAVAKWLNDPYGDRTIEETSKIWDAVRDRSEIQALSPQIYSEFEWLARWHEGWHIT